MKQIFFVLILQNLIFSANLVIYYSSSLNGNLDGCTCKSAPKAGLVKRAFLLKELQNKNTEQSITVDTGDFFDIYPDAMTANYLLPALNSIKFDAVCPGDQEFINGLAFFRKITDTLPVVCANLTITGQDFYKTYITVNKGKLRLAIIGIIAKNTFRYFRNNDVVSKLTINDEIATIKKTIEEVRSAHDCLILLSHSGYDADQEYAKAAGELDVIISGHSQTLLEKPRKIGNTLIVSSGDNGNLQGELMLEFKDGKITGYRHKLHYISYEKDPDEPAIRKMINTLKAERQGRP